MINDHQNYVPERWHQFLIYIGYNIVAFFVNAFLNSALPYVTRAACTDTVLAWQILFLDIDGITVIWSITGFAIISITVLACSSPNFNSGE